MTGWIGVDLDGTLARDMGEYHYVGPPVALMVERVKRYLTQGYEVRVVTARVAPEWDQAEAQRQMIESWCEEHIGQRLTVQAHKTGSMIRLYDDRAVGVIANQGHLAHEIHRAVDVALAAQRIESTFYNRTGIHMDARTAEALAEAVLSPHQKKT